jgi:hypothetical protein
MADYKAIRGFTIHTVDGDPSNLVAGQVWYNSSSKKVKGSKLAAAAWASGGNQVNIAKARVGFGVYNAGHTAGGISGAGANQKTNESYDGTTWTETTDLNAARAYAAGCGTATAGLFFGGLNPSDADVGTSEEWNGSGWTEGDNMNTARHFAASAGTQTAGMCVGGTPGPGAFETYNGTSWTEEDHGLVGGRRSLSGWGITTSALMAGGSPNVVDAETYDGSSWTEISNLNTGRSIDASSKNTGGVGTDGIAIAGDGSTPHMNITEQYNGSTWSEVADVPASFQGGCGFGTGSNAVAQIANTPPNTYVNTTAEWTGEYMAAVTFTSS